MKRLRPDVVHVHVGIVSPFAWSGIAAARRLGLPIAITFHSVLGSWAGAVGALGPLSPVRRWQQAGADLTAVSSMLARQVEAAGAQAPVAVLPNGITVADWRPDRPAGRDDRRPLRVVASLRWIELKRPLQVVRVFTSAIARCGDRETELYMYGDGPLRARLAQEAAASGAADRIALVGRVERDELARAFARADIYLHTSPVESFGISVLEARSAGLAVIALRTSTSGVGDFITDGVDGLLADDDAGLADALTSLLRDPGLLERIKEHNRTVAPLSEWATVTEMNVNAYRRAIALREGL